MLDILLATPLWLRKMAYFLLPIVLLDVDFCIDLVANNFFKIVNTNLEHPVRGNYFKNLRKYGHHWKI